MSARHIAIKQLQTTPPCPFERVLVMRLCHNAPIWTAAALWWRLERVLVAYVPEKVAFSLPQHDEGGVLSQLELVAGMQFDGLGHDVFLMFVMRGLNNGALACHSVDDNCAVART